MLLEQFLTNSLAILSVRRPRTLLRTCLGVLFVTFACSSVRAQNSPAPEIWYQPGSDLVTPAGYKRNPDYQQLFNDSPTWPLAISRISAFGIPHPDFVSKAPEAEARRIFSFLKAHQIPLVVPWNLVNGAVNGKGSNVEGTYHQPQTPLHQAMRMKELGGEVGCVIADEPLRFGHYFGNAKAKTAGKEERIGCQYPIKEVAAQVADAVRQIRTVFPNAKFVETEPVNGLGSMEELDQWLVALKKELKEIPIEHVDLDVQWERGEWQKPCKEMVEVIKKNGLSYGLIVDGGPHDTSDAAWVEHAKRNFQEWTSAIKEPMACVRFQSWHPCPSHVLPETGEETILSLVNWHSSAHP